MRNRFQVPLLRVASRILTQRVGRRPGMDPTLRETNRIGTGSGQSHARGTAPGPAPPIWGTETPRPGAASRSGCAERAAVALRLAPLPQRGVLRSAACTPRVMAGDDASGVHCPLHDRAHARLPPRRRLRPRDEGQDPTLLLHLVRLGGQARRRLTPLSTNEAHCTAASRPELQRCASTVRLPAYSPCSSNHDAASRLRLPAASRDGARATRLMFRPGHATATSGSASAQTANPPTSIACLD
jgi:hypothetical protein